MTVYVVIGGCRSHHIEVMLVTTDPQKAEQFADAKWNEYPRRLDYVDIEKWNTATGEYDSSYQTRVTS